MGVNDEAEKRHSLCERFLHKHLKDSPMVVFLLGALSKAKCPYRINQFECIPCPEGGAIGGHFDFDSGKISICEDAIQSTTQVEDTLSHELIHAFDNCRAELSRTNCKQVACSEIRASNLSGECKWSRELLRGNFYPVAAAHKACVRRRVRLSLEQNKEACGDCGDIDKIIDQVWDPCYNDTAPFIEIP